MKEFQKQVLIDIAADWGIVLHVYAFTQPNTTEKAIVDWLLKNHKRAN